MNTLLRNHFDVQNGMYFNDYFTSDQWTFFTSKIIEDGFWNYAVMPNNANLKNELPLVEKIFADIHRPSSIYIVNEDEQREAVSFLKEQGYELISKESFMTYNGGGLIKPIPSEIRIERATSEVIVRDFIKIFANAYGGEISPEQPYGELDKTYLDALGNSFEDGKFYHFVCYHRLKPVSIASLCIADGVGGIYNVGTNPTERGKGYGTFATNACISEWLRSGGKELLLQTETGSSVEKWYYSLGFKLEFYGSIYSKE